MRKLIIFLSLILIGSIAYSQATLGLKAGINSNTLIIDEDDFETIDKRNAFVGGLYIKVGEGTFFIQPEVLYSQKGGEYGYSTITNQMDTTFSNKVNYLDIPVMVGINFGESVTIHTGPVLNILITEKVEYNTNGDLLRIDDTIFKDNTFGWAVGASFQYRKFILGVRHEFSLIKIIDTFEVPDTDIVLDAHGRNSLWQFSIAYQLTD